MTKTLTISAEPLILHATWTSTVSCVFNADGSLYRCSVEHSNESISPSKVVRFPINLPAGAKLSGARVHAVFSTGLYGGEGRINGQRPGSDGFVPLSISGYSAGTVDVPFTWTAYLDSESTYRHLTNGSSLSATYTYEKASTCRVTEVYLEVQYKPPCAFRLAENGALVPYQLYRAERGALVPYQLWRAEDGVLVSYG